MKSRLLIAAMLCLAAMTHAQNFTDMTSILNRTGGSAPCIVDMNNDGLDDVVIISQGDLYIDRQQSDGTFVQYYYDTNFQNSPSWSISAGDLDQNGYMDLMFGGGSRVSFVYANNTGTAYSETYINDYIFSQRTNIVDIDNDGDLDAFACHDVDLSHPYRNNGTGTMTEDQSLIQTVPLAGNYASVWTDFDNDGDVDMYLSKCRQGSVTGATERENALYVNDGNGNYSLQTTAYGLFDNQQSWVTIFEDFDNDGDLDTYTVNHTGTNFLRQNDGTGHYTEINAGSGIDATDLDSWACVGADFDNDGFVDILTESNVSKQMYHNNGNMNFTSMSRPFDDGALGDLNNDGFIDVFTGIKLWMNDGNENHFLKVHLVGTESNVNGIGARLEIYGAWGKQIRECRSGESFNPMSSLDEIFGIGTATAVDSLIVRWPSGVVDVLTAPAIDSRVTVVESPLTPPCMAPSNLDVVEIGFGEINPRVNATWVNPEATLSCEVRGGRISDTSAGTQSPVFQNINNTRILNQTNGTTVAFNIALYNNPNIPFVQGKTYGFDVRCQCADASGFSDWSAISSSSTFIVPYAPAGAAQSVDGIKALVSDLKVYPNPNDGSGFSLELERMTAGKVSISVLEMSGRQVAVEEFQVKEGSSIIRMDLNQDLAAGIYMIQMNSAETIYQARIIIE